MIFRLFRFGKIKKSAFLFLCLAALMAGSGACFAAEILSSVQNSPYGALPSTSVSVMAAYQKPYAMNFEIWQPAGLPSGWYATFDGFPVAQISENRWVYGKLGLDGAIIPTDILVGSVIPTNVPGLVRVAAVGNYGMYISSEEFRKILNYGCNRMAFLNDPYMRTVIAWSDQRPGVYLWLGDRWKRFSPNSGEYTWQVLKRNRVWINEELRKNNVWWPVGDHFETADMARQCGILWLGEFVLENLNYINRNSGGDAERARSLSRSDNTNTETPDNNQNNNDSRGNWDARR